MKKKKGRVTTMVVSQWRKSPRRMELVVVVAVTVELLLEVVPRNVASECAVLWKVKEGNDEGGKLGC